ncbi:ExeM/NucH family extracellular endonuclease (plasmid) [Sphaerotilus natans]|uniref:ExeM/NucH family extracellular endonuclease n=1 Tax=Sphaerotilus natans TaxID=34103 RepID=UPI00406D0DA4
MFVFNADRDEVSVGQRVRVTGSVSEFQGQTQLSAQAGTLVACGSGTVAPTDLRLPFASADEAERLEGMLVRLPQTLQVTEHYQLARFGQVLLSSAGRQIQPTQTHPPGAAAQALLQAQQLDRLILDDARNAQNDDPILFARGGLPLSATNTLRGGDSISGVVGVMTWTWAGASASGNAWRVRPIGALGGSLPAFQPTNPRPTHAPSSQGTLRVASFNVLNFFDNVAGCTGGVGGTSMACRGAGSDVSGAAAQAAQFAIEYPRQRAKTVAAIGRMHADVVGLIEIENDGHGPGSALRALVDALDAASAPGTWAALDVDARLGTPNRLGSDAIKVALIYRPARVKPVGRTAVLDSAEFVRGGDASARNRPALAQAFEQADGARFVVAVNHLKSKGSACDTPDAGDGQGECAQVRRRAAVALRQWLATDPTTTGEADLLVIGDLNAYAREEAVTAFTASGWTDLIARDEGAQASSYAFDGRWGYLDHALASASMAAQVVRAQHWAINADEPAALDYNINFKSAGLQASLYAADAFRSSDHDPVLIDLRLTPPRLMSGGPGSDRLTGSAADEILVGGPGRDLLSGGAGRDQFVMRSLLEAGDIIGDFQPGIDVLVLDELLRSLGIAGSQALSGGWLVCATHGSDALIGIDVDGARGPLASRPLMLLRGVGCAALLARPESLKL